MDPFTIEIGHHRFHCEAASDDDRDAITIDSTAADNQETLVKAIRTALVSRHWRLDERLHQRPLTGQWRFECLGQGTDVYNFGADFTPNMQSFLVHGLSLLASALHGRSQSIWNLQGIDIVPLVIKNAKSGWVMRGNENRGHERFALLQGCLHERNSMEEERCPELSWTTIHEAAHIMLDGVLLDRWKQALGWEMSCRYQGYVPILPGGSHAYMFLREPQLAPTLYASFQPDDDLAESAAAFLLAPWRLGKDRRELLASVMSEPDPTVTGEFVPVRPELPHLPDKVAVVVEESSFKPIFRPVGPDIDTEELVEIPYADFVRGIREGTIRRRSE